MGIKLNFKRFIAKKLKTLLVEKTPVLMVSEESIVVGIESYHNGNFAIRGGGCKAKIGSYCAIGKDVKLILNNHEISFASMQYSFYEKYFNKSPFTKTKSDFSITIGSDVWIGDNVTILPNVIISHGAVIGAGSIVTKNVKPFSIVAGNPAKEIRKRFSDNTIEDLLRLEWWTWDSSIIKENEEFFFKNLNNHNGN